MINEMSEKELLLKIISKLPSNMTLADGIKECYGIDVNRLKSEMMHPSKQEHAKKELLALIHAWEAT